MERLLRKTGRDIYKLRRTRVASKGQVDVQAFKEKMAFFTNIRHEVPVVVSGEEDEADDVIEEAAASGVTSSLSSETVNTLTGEEGGKASSSSAATVAAETTNEPAERFSYEIDPDIGVIV